MKYDLIISNPPYGKIGNEITRCIVDSIYDIPDTDKTLGVPVSIMCNFCCDRGQFEIIDVTCDCWVDGKLKFKRILVKLKKYVK